MQSVPKTTISACDEALIYAVKFTNQSIIFILINHIQRYREDINIHITNTE